MTTIKASERCRFQKPEGLNELQSATWDYFFEHGWSIFVVDTDGGYLVLDEGRYLDDARFFQGYESFENWLQTVGEELKEDGQF